MSVSVTKRSDLVVGIWKFDERVGELVVCDLAVELKNAQPSQYEQVLVRRCSKNQLGVCYTYRLGDGESYSKFFYRETDKLKRRFGNDFVGYDITSEVWTLSDLPTPIPLPFPFGTPVRTTRANMSLRKEWTDEAWANRQWGAKGTILKHHDSHGLFYKVQHEDGTVGCYDPSELEVVG